MFAPSLLVLHDTSLSFAFYSIVLTISIKCQHLLLTSLIFFIWSHKTHSPSAFVDTKLSKETETVVMLLALRVSLLFLSLHRACFFFSLRFRPYSISFFIRNRSCFSFMTVLALPLRFRFSTTFLVFKLFIFDKLNLFI